MDTRTSVLSWISSKTTIIITSFFPLLLRSLYLEPRRRHRTFSISLKVILAAFRRA